MSVILNKGGLFGAKAITDTEYLSSIYDEEGEFYIIPSSIHELIVIPSEAFPSVEEVKEMKGFIAEVNANEVKPCEILSNNLYKFDGKEVSIVND